MAALESDNPATPAQDPAGFWIRLGAFLIDFVFVWLPVIFSLVFINERVIRRGILNSTMYAFILGPLIILFYHAYVVGRWGQSLGKFCAGIMVVTKTGGKVGYLRVIGRTLLWSFALFLSLCGFAAVLPFHVGMEAVIPPFFLVCLVGSILQKRFFFYDYLCGTRIVYKHPKNPRRKAGVILFGVITLSGFCYRGLYPPPLGHEKQRIAEAMSVMHAVRSAQEIYLAKHGTYAAKFTELHLDYHGMTASKIPTKFFVVTTSSINCGATPCYKLTATRHSDNGAVASKYGAYSLSITIPDSPEVRIATCPGGETNCDELIK